MAKPEFKKPEGVQVKQPSAAELFGDAAVPETPDDWRTFDGDGSLAGPMDRFGAAPFDGFPVELKDRREATQDGRWKLSRRYDQSKQRFVPYGFWVCYPDVKRELPFVPMAWRPSPHGKW